MFISLNQRETMSNRYDPANPNSGHGHVYPRPDRVVFRCGGPVICKSCGVDALCKIEANPLAGLHWQLLKNWLDERISEASNLGYQDSELRQNLTEVKQAMADIEAGKHKGSISY